MTVGDVSRPYVRIFVNETVFPSVRVGDTASVVLDAFPGRGFRGQIVSVSSMRKAQLVARYNF